MKGINAMKAVTRINDKYIEAAELDPSVLAAGTPAGQAERGKRFWSSGWTAAACVLVGVGVYIGLLGLGRGWFGGAAGRHGTSETETDDRRNESYPETDGETNAAPDGTGSEADAETRDTPDETLPETEEDPEAKARAAAYTPILQGLIGRVLSDAAAQDGVTSRANLTAYCTTSDGETVYKRLESVSNAQGAYLLYDAGPAHSFIWTLLDGTAFRESQDPADDPTAIRYEPDDAAYAAAMDALRTLNLTMTADDLPALVCTVCDEDRGAAGTASVSRALTEQLLRLTGLDQWGVSADSCTAEAVITMPSFPGFLTADPGDPEAMMYMAAETSIQVTIAADNGVSASIALICPNPYAEIGLSAPRSSRKGGDANLTALILDALRPGSYPTASDVFEDVSLATVDVMRRNAENAGQLTMTADFDGSMGWETPFISENFMFPMSVTQSQDDGNLYRRAASALGSAEITLYGNTLYIRMLYADNLILRPEDERYGCVLTDGQAEELRGRLAIVNCIPSTEELRAPLAVQENFSGLQKRVKISAEERGEPAFVAALMAMSGLPIERDPASDYCFRCLSLEFGVGRYPGYMGGSVIYSRAAAETTVDVTVSMTPSIDKPIAPPDDADAYEMLSYEAALSRLTAKYPVFGFGE